MFEMDESSSDFNENDGRAPRAMIHDPFRCGSPAATMHEERTRAFLLRRPYTGRLKKETSNRTRKVAIARAAPSIAEAAGTSPDSRKHVAGGKEQASAVFSPRAIGD
jgi:hypothetical protein